MSALIAWDAGGNIVATLDEVRRDGSFLDIEASETSGIKLRTYWNVTAAVASGTWPERLGSLFHDYRVELGDGRPMVVALIHRETGERRERPVETPVDMTG